MNKITIPIEIPSKSMKDIRDFNKGDRLFYELGHKINPNNMSFENNWVRTGKFKEITNPIEYLKNEDRFGQVGFIEHHNFMIVECKDISRALELL